jgi:hypothetical protein
MIKFTAFAAPLLASCCLLLVSALPGCKAAKSYPDPLPGWHNASYTTVLGRLQRMPAVKPENPPVWVIRFGNAADPYRGEFAVTPPERLTGYSGGELVEVKGNIRPDMSHPDYAGTWYEIQSIRMWSNRR